MAIQTSGSGGGTYNPNPQKKTDGTYGYDPAAAAKALSNNGSPANTQYGQQNMVRQQQAAIPASSPGFVPPTQNQPQPANTGAPQIQQAANTNMFNTGPQMPPGEGYGPGFGEKYGMSHVGQYDTPTMLETFAQQQLNGNNPYYDRLRQQGMDAINQQMIARGHGNSGGALAALGNFAGALGAQQFADMGNLLGSASGMGLNRMGQGQNVANQVQQLQMGRLGQQWGQASDMAHLGAGLVGGFYGQGGAQSGDAAMAGINAGANAAGLTGQGQQVFPNMAMQGLKTFAAS